MSSRRHALLVLVAACSPAAVPPPPSAPETPPLSTQEILASVPDLMPPPLRLPGDVRPRRYALELTIDPTRDTFEGVIRIDAEVVRPTQVVWLNATGLTVTRSTLAAHDARVIAGGDDFLGLLAGHELAPGPLAIEIAYRAPIDRERSRGVYAEQEGDDWYAYTFFEPLDARRAFPSFDEPSYKVPWQLTFRVRKDHVALANTPVVSETDDGDLKKVVLAESRPLPSYLIAFVVGPFDVIDGGVAGRARTPVRFVVPRGRGAETRWAKEVTPKVVAALEDFFDMAYPYEKLDVAVVPRFWGTMEHPGIVAMGQPLTLIQPDQETRSRRIGYTNILGHELAHYWFGDLVTMAWWNDTWLNESLGTWVDPKITDRVDPSWRYLDGRVLTAAQAMRIDELPTTRAIRQPAETKEAIAASFDGAITYYKGATVLGMFEQWVGPDRFRAFIRTYLNKHAWGNASAEDFFAVMGAELGDEVVAAFRTFLEQSGVPLITHQLRCEAGKASLHLEQRRSVPADVTNPAEGTWHVPVCVRHGVGTQARRICTLLTGAEATVPLEGPCPEWLVVNAGGDGYYRTRYGASELKRLLAGPRRPPLTVRERLIVSSDVNAALDRAELPIGDALRLVPALAQDDDERIVSRAIGLAGRMRPDFLDDDLYRRHRRFAIKTFGARARQLGWTRKPADDDERHELRRSLVPLVAYAGDAQLQGEARRLAEAWLRDRKAVPDDLVGSVLFVAAAVGDRALFDAYLDATRKATDRREQQRLLGVLGAFRDPTIAATARELVTGSEFDLRETRVILLSQLSDRDLRNEAWRFLTLHLDELFAKMRHDEAAGFIGSAASTFCDRPRRDETAALLTPRAATIEGAQNSLTKALESVDRCIATRERELPGIRTFLARY